MIRFPHRARTGRDALTASMLDEWISVRHVYRLFQELKQLHGGQAAMLHVATAADEERARRLTYTELLQGITRCANLLRANGAELGTTVGLLLPNLVESQFMLWGAATAAAALPLNPLLTPDALAQLMRAANTRVLVALGPMAGSDLWDKTLALRQLLGDQLACIIQAGGAPSDQPGVIQLADVLESASDKNLDFTLRPRADDAAAYFHTGGTTSAPKLVRHTHLNQLAAAFGFATSARLSSADTITNGFPLFHVAGAICLSLAPFMAGACVLNLSPAGFRNPAMVQNYWRLVERYRVTIAGGIPTAISAVVAVPARGADLSSLRCGYSGGAPLPRSTAKRFEAVTGCHIFEMLGMTETAGVIAVEPAEGSRVLGSVGYAAGFVRCEVREIGAGGVLGGRCLASTPGMLVVRGPNVISGYVDPSHDEHSFTSDGWLITGDLACMDADGRISIVGRGKDVIIRSGHNIDPAHIEEVALKHPAVVAAAAVAQPDRYAGELPVCYVVPRHDWALDMQALREHFRCYVAEAPAVPKQVYVVETLPTTAVGKIFKPQLRCDAARRLLNEMLTDVPDLHIAVEEGPYDGMLVTFTCTKETSSPDAVQALLKQRLSGFLFRWQVVDVAGRYGNGAK